MPTSSLESVARLLSARTLRGMAAAVSLRPPVSARQIFARASFAFLPGWELVTRNAIAKDEANNVWHAGHLEDVLPLEGGRLLLASQTGGVWLAFADGQSDPVPLGDTWRKPDIHSLCTGSKGPRHFYAGGTEGGLYETETESLLTVARFMGSGSVRDMAARLNLGTPISVRALMRLSDAPLFDWREASLAAPDGTPFVAEIRKVLVVPGLQPAKIVLATDGGVFWSDIPALGHGYQLSVPTGIPQNQCLGLALGPNNRVVASPTGSPTSPDANGIYFGAWLFGNLIMRKAQHLGDIDFRQWQYAVVATSSNDRSIFYSVVSASGSATLSLRSAFKKAGISDVPASTLKLAQQAGFGKPISLAALITKFDPPAAHDTVYAVLASEDGGATWAPAGPNRRVEESIRFARSPGASQEGYNISLAVSHANPDTMALGWRIGPWVGRKTPTAFVWEEHGDEGATPGARSPHIHADSHGMVFDPHDPTGRTFYMCSDGGLVSTTDLFATFGSSINRLLPNLQFQSYPPRQANGAAGVSLQTPGLVVGPLQDNGVVFSFQKDGAQRPWQRITVADDGMVAILLQSDLVLFWNNDNTVARIRRWDGNQFGPEINVTVKAPSSTVPAGSTLSNPFAEPILHPAFQRPDTHQSMFAIGAYDPASGYRDLWGLFADDDGGNPVWDFIATVGLDPPDSITAAGSDDGRRILVGSSAGKLYSCDVASGTVSAMPIDPTSTAPAGPVYQFAFMRDGTAFARYQGGMLRLQPGQASWTNIGANGLPPATREGSLYFAAVDTEKQPNILYVATDYGVHASWDAGANWLPVSQGLPMRCHPSTLRFIVEPDSSRHLYLTTYGRSAWRTRLN
jgi:hypothetical protein